MLPYNIGPIVKFGPGGEYVQEWPEGQSYEWEEDDPTPVDEIKATITPGFHWERIMMVGMCVSYFLFGMFVGWIVAK